MGTWAAKWVWMPLLGADDADGIRRRTRGVESQIAERLSFGFGRRCHGVHQGGVAETLGHHRDDVDRSRPLGLGKRCDACQISDVRRGRSDWMAEADGCQCLHSIIPSLLRGAYVGGGEHADTAPGQPQRHAELSEMMVRVATGVVVGDLGVDHPTAGAEPPAMGRGSNHPHRGVQSNYEYRKVLPRFPAQAQSDVHASPPSRLGQAGLLAPGSPLSPHAFPLLHGAVATTGLSSPVTVAGQRWTHTRLPCASCRNATEREPIRQTRLVYLEQTRLGGMNPGDTSAAVCVP